ncbi:MAG: hypothetical protein AB7O52_11395 [Planctomycetota bacterium]
MACPGRRRWVWGLAASLLLTVGCRYHMVLIEDGAPLARADYDRIEVGVATRAEVLATLGAPDGIRYTPSEEILDFRGALHRGSDLQFILPTVVFQWGSLASIAVGTAKAIAPVDEPKSIQDEVWVIRLARFIFGSLASLSPYETGGADTLTFTGQRLRYDRIRLVLDRRTAKVIEKSMIDAASTRNGSNLRDAFLIEKD